MLTWALLSRRNWRYPKKRVHVQIGGKEAGQIKDKATQIARKSWGHNENKTFFIPRLQHLELKKPHHWALADFHAGSLSWWNWSIEVFVFQKRESQSTRKKPSKQGANQQQTRRAYNIGLGYHLDLIGGPGEKESTSSLQEEWWWKTQFQYKSRPIWLSRELNIIASAENWIKIK